MPDYTVNIDLSAYKRGDKWVGIPVIGPVLINGGTPPTPLARIRSWFVHETGAIFKLDTDATTAPDSAISIVNEAAWSASVPSTQKFLPLAGIWTWDMEFYASGETSPLTLYSGSITVYGDTTR